MPVILAYIFVVFIWATTPLAIHWSNSSLAFATSVSLRMVLALVLCSILMVIFRIPLVKHKRDWTVFLAGMVGLYPNMLLVYWSAQYISSGLMAVILGLYPFAVGLFSLLLLKENVFNLRRIVALLVAIAGLAVIHIEQIQLSHSAFYGIVGMLGSAFLFAFSSVCVKALGGGMNPLRQTTGVLFLAVPAFAVTWFFVDGEIPAQIDSKSIIGVSYLSVAGTAVGYTLFFYVLRNCSMVSVSLIPLITPVLALSIGYLFANEAITLFTLVGSALVIVSLGIYQCSIVKLGGHGRRMLYAILLRYKLQSRREPIQSVSPCMDD